MSDMIAKHKSEADKIISFFEQEIGRLRIGRASPSLVEGVQVEAYGSFTPVTHLASVSVTDSKTLTIRPWDKSVTKFIEKALNVADVGSVSVDGDIVRVTMAPLTEETRKDVVKKLHVKAEDAKISFKTLREEIKKEIVNAETEKMISQDEKFAYLDELEDFIKDYHEKLKIISDKKEEDVMKI